MLFGNTGEVAQVGRWVRMLAPYGKQYCVKQTRFLGSYFCGNRVS
jgi:hypothetical protein